MTTIRVERDVAVPMRDGVVLRADLYLPDRAEPAPALVQRTPYDKTLQRLTALVADPLRLSQLGFAVVVQDVRGRFASEGELAPFVEGEDGYDTVEWCATQPWCNGRVGMFGASYPGIAVLQAAALRPPHLGAIAPTMTGPSPYDHWLYPGQAFALGFALSWSLILAPNNVSRRIGSPGARAARIVELLDAMDEFGKRVRDLPLASSSITDWETVAPWYGDWLRHPAGADDYWQRLEIDLTAIDVPCFFTAGWYDLFLRGTLDAYAGCTGAPERKLLVGPWVHGFPWLETPVGDMSFGIRSNGSVIDHAGQTARWFQRCLEPGVSSEQREPPVRVFVMGANAWRDEPSWPPARATATRYFLRSHGRLEPVAGNAEPADQYEYDPRDPTPVRGGGLCCSSQVLDPGAFDQRPLEQRPDVLCYTSDPLPADLTVAGPVQAVLSVASTAEATDFVARLVDVEPSGRSLNILEGVQRVSSLMPDRSEVRIDMASTAHVFRRGHRVRLHVASASFPRVGRHPNLAGNLAVETRLEPATQSVFPAGSWVELPVLS